MKKTVEFSTEILVRECIEYLHDTPDINSDTSKMYINFLLTKDHAVYINEILYVWDLLGKIDALSRFFDVVSPHRHMVEEIRRRCCVRQERNLLDLREVRYIDLEGLVMKPDSHVNATSQTPERPMHPVIKGLNIPEEAKPLLSKITKSYIKFDEREGTFFIKNQGNIKNVVTTDFSTRTNLVGKISRVFDEISEYCDVTPIFLASRYYVSVAESAAQGMIQISDTFDCSIITANNNHGMIAYRLVSELGIEFLILDINESSYSTSRSIIEALSKVKFEKGLYKTLPIEKFIDRCKRRVLGEKYNPELQYTKLTPEMIS